jgi:citronellol/citronellal dehydrogenase
LPSRIFRDDLLEGQVCLVTGGGTGIGVATARELARLGATVVIASRKREVIERAAAGLTAEVGREVFAIPCDIRDREQVSALVAETLRAHRRLDVLVNNGGGQFFAPAQAISGRGFDAVIATNLTGAWNLTREVADRWMLAHGGCVTNVTMLTGGAFPGMAHSVAARAGVEAMTRTLAIEWASHGVRINSIAPGFVASSGIQRYPAGLSIMDQIQSKVPLKRLATTEEIAWWIVSLATPMGAYVTGQTFTIDGGKSLWGDWWPIADPASLGPVVVPKEPWEE